MRRKGGHKTAAEAGKSFKTGLKTGLKGWGKAKPSDQSGKSSKIRGQPMRLLPLAWWTASLAMVLLTTPCDARHVECIDDQLDGEAMHRACALRFRCCHYRQDAASGAFSFRYCGCDTRQRGWEDTAWGRFLLEHQDEYAKTGDYYQTPTTTTAKTTTEPPKEPPAQSQKEPAADAPKNPAAPAESPAKSQKQQAKSALLAGSTGGGPPTEGKPQPGESEGGSQAAKGASEESTSTAASPAPSPSTERAGPAPRFLCGPETRYWNDNGAWCDCVCLGDECNRLPSEDVLCQVPKAATRLHPTAALLTALLLIV